MKFSTYKLPAFWAPYLINGDESGYQESEVKTINDWLDENGLSNCVDVQGEPDFCTYHDAHHFVLACNCLEYTFQE